MTGEGGLACDGRYPLIPESSLPFQVRRQLGDARHPVDRSSVRGPGLGRRRVQRRWQYHALPPQHGPAGHAAARARLPHQGRALQQLAVRHPAGHPGNAVGAETHRRVRCGRATRAAGIGHLRSFPRPSPLSPPSPPPSYIIYPPSFPPAGNAINGTIPGPTLGSLASLTYLQLSSNQISGVIPTELGAVTTLTFLGLSNSTLGGSLPTQLGRLVHLTQLSVDHALLSGTLPTQLANLTSLTCLQLDNNRISGVIPTELGALVQLTLLSLAADSFWGTLPAQLSALALVTQNFSVSGNTCLYGPKVGGRRRGPDPAAALTPPT